jgi:hypothetical protein
MPPILLEEFLDASAKPAIIISSEDYRFSRDSVKVCYANRTFLDILGDTSAPAGTSSADYDHLTSMILTKCVHPSTSRFMKWTETVLQSATTEQTLRTSFEAHNVTQEQSAPNRQQIVDIVWKAVVVQQTYIVLTGKSTGTVSYFKGETPTMVESRPPSQTSSQPSIRVDTADNTDNEFRKGSVSSDSSTPSMRSGKAASSNSTTYFTDSFSDTTTPAIEKGVNPWRHKEKVSFKVLLLIVADP